MTRFAIALLALALLSGCDRTTPPPPAPAHTSAAATPQRALYQCPMHPQIIRTEPGTCPICGMTLQRVDETNASTPGVADHASFVLTPERQQLIGVTQAPVSVRPLTLDIRAAATVANDTAQYQAVIEYREALRARGALRATTSAAGGGDALVTAAVLKLRRLGIGDRDVPRLADLDPTTFILPGPKVWIYAQVFEEDVGLLTPGMPLTIDVPSASRAPIEAAIFSIDPVIDPDSRTVRVRALVDTPRADLRPSTFVTATLHVSLGDVLAIPRAAVLPAGTHRLAFVVSADGRFTPRDLQLGRVAGDYYEVRGGLTAGEHVVTSANFLIDSESRFKAAVAAFVQP